MEATLKRALAPFLGLQEQELNPIVVDEPAAPETAEVETETGAQEATAEEGGELKPAEA